MIIQSAVEDEFDDDQPSILVRTSPVGAWLNCAGAKRPRAPATAVNEGRAQAAAPDGGLRVSDGPAAAFAGRRDV